MLPMMVPPAVQEITLLVGAVLVAVLLAEAVPEDRLN
jgi:hypothetical protein